MLSNNVLFGKLERTGSEALWKGNKKKGYSTVYTAEMDEKNREFMLFHDDATGGL